MEVVSTVVTSYMYIHTRVAMRLNTSKTSFELPQPTLQPRELSLLPSAFTGTKSTHSLPEHSQRQGFVIRYVNDLLPNTDETEHVTGTSREPTIHPQ